MDKKWIPLAVPNLKGNEIEYVTQTLETEWVSSAGADVGKFEMQIACTVKARGAVACQSGTAGLHIALLCDGIGPNEEVIVPALTFIAAVNPVKYVGAEPVFMDCDDSLTMDPEKLREFCENACSFKQGRLINNQTQKHITAIVVVHVFGNLAEMEKIMDIAGRFNLKVIEDATEALGSYYLTGRYAGRYAGTIGDIGVYSFNGNKIITTGSGGMIVSDDTAILKHAKHLTTQAKQDEVYYLHDEIGYNYRLTNLQAALGRAQLEQLETFIATKRSNYDSYVKKIAPIPSLKMLPFRDDIRPNYWFYALYCEDNYPLGRDALISFLAQQGIQTRPIWGLICDQKPYRDHQAYKIEKARVYLEHVVNLPCSSNLTKADVEYVSDCLKKAATH